jgi:hypothetical protein
MGEAKRRGTYQERVRQAKKNNIPSFIKQLDIDSDNNITYDKSDLVSSQCAFIDNIIKVWKDNGQLENKKDLYSYVFYGKKDDFSGVLLEGLKDGVDPDKAFRESQDMFFARYWGTTNQAVSLSAEYCDKVIEESGFGAPIGAKLTDSKHDFSNFAIAVAYNRMYSRIAKTQMGDLCPPECDPDSELYNEQFIPKVKEALSKFNIVIECDWRPGSVHTTFKQAA